MDNDRDSPLKARKLADEVKVLKNELKHAIEAEENNKKAMDGLAMALQEVMSEAKQAKDKLSLAQEEIEATKEVVEGLKVLLQKAEEQNMEAKREVDKYKNFSDRLRLESDETLSAWNEKEKGFIECIRNVEEERNFARHENKMLVASLKHSKEETQKLRDIMKQAINEANVAKDSAGVAKEENSQLKDEISQLKDEISHLKDELSHAEEALSILSQENERLRVKEAKEIEAPPPPSAPASSPALTSSRRTTMKDILDMDDHHHKESTSTLTLTPTPTPSSGHTLAPSPTMLMTSAFGPSPAPEKRTASLTTKETLEMDDHHDQPQKENNHKDNHHDKEQNPKDHHHEKEHNHEEHHHKDQHHEKEPSKRSRHFRANSSCLTIKFPYIHKYPQQPQEEDLPKIPFRDSDEDSDSDYFDPLRGSIFDVAETPKAEAGSGTSTHHSKKAFFFFTDDEPTNNEEFHQLDSTHFEEETDKSLRKKKPLLSRFGDLIRVRSFYKKEQPPLEQQSAIKE